MTVADFTEQQLRQFVREELDRAALSVRVRQLQAGVLLEGTGSPEGVVTARVGEVYRRRDGGAGTSLYVKESGSGSSGWVAK